MTDKDKLKEMYEQNQDKICDSNSFEFICNNTLFYMFVNNGKLIGAIYNFLDENGKLKFIKYRDMNYQKGLSQGSKEWCEKDCMPILFGMYQVPEDAEELIITEGQMDTLAVATAGYDNVVSVPMGCKNMEWVTLCWDWLDSFNEISRFQ